MATNTSSLQQDANLLEQDEYVDIDEEDDVVRVQDVDEQDMVLFTPDESKEEPFNMAIDDTSVTQLLLWANWSPPHLSQMTFTFQLRR